MANKVSLTANHNKKRNSALLHEFLVRHISKCLLENKKDSAQKAASLAKKYFGANSPLRKELDLFNIVLTTEVKSKESAQKILEMVYRNSKKLNVRDLDQEKSKLIKEINYSFGKEVYSHKIPNYTTYASIQTLLNGCRSKNKVVDEVGKIKLEEQVVGYLLEGKCKEGLKTNKDYNNTVYNLIVQKFYRKYENKLSESQRKFMTNYIVYMISENKENFKKYFSEKIVEIKQKLSNIKDEAILKDKEIPNKLAECRDVLSSISTSDLSESNVLTALQFIKLVEEIES